MARTSVSILQRVVATSLMAGSGVVMVLAFLVPTSAAAQQGDWPAINGGRRSYSRYCANCHGKEGRGDGTIAEWMKIPPTDLTRIQAEHGGAFPREGMEEVIDGREVAGHGSREMPIWGDAFRDPEGGDGQSAEVAKKISDLVSFLESIQKE